MTHRYLLDTNIFSDLVRHPEGRVASIVQEREKEHVVSTSIIVAAESRYDAVKSGSKRIAARIEELFTMISILPLEFDADIHYARIRVDLERRGLIIGGNDLFIAAHALATGSILVTHNAREFSRVKGLMVENWLADREPG